LYGGAAGGEHSPFWNVYAGAAGTGDYTVAKHLGASMSWKVLLCAIAAAVLLPITQAKAVTYSYVGTPDGSYFNNYLTAVVDLNCIGACAAGVYVLGAGLQSYQMTAHNSSGGALNSADSSSAATTAPGQSYVNYLTLNSSGNVTNWFLYLIKPSFDEFWTIGFDPTYGTQDHAEGPVGGSNGNLLFQFVHGSWTANVATPLPAALPLFATGLAGLGWLARRRRKQAA